MAEETASQAISSLCLPVEQCIVETFRTPGGTHSEGLL